MVGEKKRKERKREREREREREKERERQKDRERKSECLKSIIGVIKFSTDDPKFSINIAIFSTYISIYWLFLARQSLFLAQRHFFSLTVVRGSQLSLNPFSSFFFPFFSRILSSKEGRERKNV